MTEEQFNKQQLEEKGYVCPKNIFHNELKLSCDDCKNYKEKKCKVYFKKLVRNKVVKND